MTEAEYLFESYNMAVENAYNRIFENNNGIDILSIGDKEISPYIAAFIKEWENTVSAELAGMTPKGYFEGINDIDVLLEHFKMGSLLCHYDLPALLLNKMKAFNEKIVPIFTGFATDKNLINDNSKFLMSVTSIKVLAQWGEGGAVESLINFLINEMGEQDINYDIVAEEISDYIAGIGAPSVEPLLEALGKAESFNSNFEYLLKALSEAGKNNKSDRIFYCLKNCFRKMDNKTLAALYIKNYGDSRAIPLLRGYAEKNIGNIDAETFYEIKHAVESLGGSMEDMNLS